MHALLILFASVTTVVNGTICRMNRSADRLILSTEEQGRLQVSVPDGIAVTFEGEDFRVEDLRPGSKIRVTGTQTDDRLEASAIDLRLKVADALFDALLGPRKTIIGRFSVREAKTEYFSLNTGEGNYIRVEAKAAYGPKGRVRVSDLRGGELLELSGDWKSKGELHASYIKVITDEEPTSCRTRARRGESKEETAAREVAERNFLDHPDD